MATTNQLIRKGRNTITEKSKVPAFKSLPTTPWRVKPVYTLPHQNQTQRCVKYAVYV